MLLKDKTIYPTLPDTLNSELIAEHYTPSQEELNLSLTKTMGPHNQLLFIAMYKLYQKLGYFIKIIDCPQAILEMIASVLKIKTPDEEFISYYDRSRQKQRHIEFIRKDLKTRLLDRKSLFNIAYRIAKTKDTMLDIVNGVIEDLVQNNNELPALSVIEACAYKARSSVNNGYYRIIYDQLQSKQKSIIQKKILIYDAKGKSVWNRIKLEPSKPTPHNIKIFAEHLKWLKEINLSSRIFEEILRVKLDSFFEESFALNFYKIRRIKEQKRTAMVAVVIYQLTIRATDDLIDMLIKLYNDLESDAKSDLLQYKMNRLDQVDELIERFNNVLHAYKEEPSQSEKLLKINAIIQNDADRLIVSCEDYGAYSKTGHFHFMSKRYIKIRKLIKFCLNLITVASVSKDKKTCDMLNYIKKHSLDQKDKIIGPSKDHGFNKKWMSTKWKIICKLGRGKICRRKFELLVLSKLIRGLASKELFMKSSFKYSDYRSALITKGTYQSKIKDYQKIINMPVEPGKLSYFIKEQLNRACNQASGNLESNGKSVFRGGKLTLKKNYWFK